MLPSRGVPGKSAPRSFTIMGSPFFGRMEFKPEQLTFAPGFNENEYRCRMIESAIFNCIIPSDVPMQ